MVLDSIVKDNFSLINGAVKNVTIFGVDTSLTLHIDNKEKIS